MMRDTAEPLHELDPTPLFPAYATSPPCPTLTTLRPAHRTIPVVTRQAARKLVDKTHSQRALCRLDAPRVPLRRVPLVCRPPPVIPVLPPPTLVFSPPSAAASSPAGAPPAASVLVPTPALLPRSPAVLRLSWPLPPASSAP